MNYKLLIFGLLLLTFNATAYVNINTCQELSNANTEYRLNADVINYGATCFTVTAENVTLDCQNHTIDGTDLATYYGVYYMHPSVGGDAWLGLTVKNCNISGWGRGVYIRDHTSITFSGDIVNATIYNNYFSNNNYDIYLMSAQFTKSIYNVTIEGNYFVPPIASNNQLRWDEPGAVLGWDIIRSNLFVNGSIDFPFGGMPLIYDNYFLYDADVDLSAVDDADLNITKQAGTNIVNGSYLGGNVWMDHTTFSASCSDVDVDGICDDSYEADTGYFDYLPLHTSYIPTWADWGNTPPVLTLNSPANGSIVFPWTYSGEWVDISVTVTDINGDDSTVYVDAGILTDVFYDVENGTVLEWDYILSDFIEGQEYNFSVNAFDGVEWTNETYYFTVWSLTCIPSTESLNVICAVNGTEATAPQDYVYFETDIGGGYISSAVGTPLNLTDVYLDYNTEYDATYWLWRESYLDLSNTETFKTYECYESASPTGCAAGFYCSVNSCLYNNSINYTATNATYSLSITDLDEVNPYESYYVTASYLNGSDEIEGATCYYTSNGFSVVTGYLSETGSHEYSSYVIAWDSPGVKSYIVTCSAAGYPTLQAVDNFTITNISGGADIQTEYAWIYSPSTAPRYSTQTYSLEYTTTGGDGVTAATCTLHIGLNEYIATETSAGVYAYSITHNTISTFNYYFVCERTGYESQTTNTLSVTVYIGSATTTTTTTTLAASPAESWNCTAPFDLLVAGDIFHATMCPLYVILGGWVFALFALITAALAWLKLETIIAPAAVMIMFGGAFMIFLPPQAQVIATLLVAVGLAGIGYGLWKS